MRPRRSLTPSRLWAPVGPTFDHSAETAAEPNSECPKLETLDKENVMGAAPRSPPPRHVAIIMDGNGRWAKARGLPRAVGHRMGVEAVRRTVRAGIELGIQYVTLYAFSSENWSRPIAEIDDLMGLMKRFIRRDLAELHHSGVRILVIGDRSNVDPELLSLIDEARELTRENNAITLVIAFNYGSRREIAGAARRLAERAVRGEIAPADITPEMLSRELDTKDVPDPELLIRTSGELRLSNFLLWQAAYTEFVFLDAFWPEFGKELLNKALDEYALRTRRFGGLSHRSSA